MNKFVYFMAVGLAFTVLQVATVEAQDTAAGLVTGANAPADCGGVPCPTGDDTHPCAAMTGDALIKCTEENPPPTGTTVAKTIDDPSCTVAPEMRATDCPPMAGGTGGGDDGVALTIGDPRCIVGAAMRDPRCPNANMP